MALRRKKGNKLSRPSELFEVPHKKLVRCQFRLHKISQVLPPKLKPVRTFQAHPQAHQSLRHLLLQHLYVSYVMLQSLPVYMPYFTCEVSFLFILQLQRAKWLLITSLGANYDKWQSRLSPGIYMCGGGSGEKTLACHNNKENDDNHWFTQYDMWWLL